MLHYEGLPINRSAHHRTLSLSFLGFVYDSDSDNGSLLGDVDESAHADNAVLGSEDDDSCEDRSGTATSIPSKAKSTNSVAVGKARTGFQQKWFVEYKSWLKCSVQWVAMSVMMAKKSVQFLVAPPEARWKCLVCSDPRLNMGMATPLDKLATTGLRHSTLTRKDKLSAHKNNPAHIAIMAAIDASNASGGPVGAHQSITRSLAPVDELLASSFVNIYWTAHRQLSVGLVEDVRQLCL